MGKNVLLSLFKLVFYCQKRQNLNPDLSDSKAYVLTTLLYSRLLLSFTWSKLLDLRLRFTIGRIYEACVMTDKDPKGRVCSVPTQLTRRTNPHSLPGPQHNSTQPTSGGTALLPGPGLGS